MPSENEDMHCMWWNASPKFAWKESVHGGNQEKKEESIKYSWLEGSANATSPSPDNSASYDHATYAQKLPVTAT